MSRLALLFKDHRPKLYLFFIFALYAFIALLFTWPLIVKINSVTYGYSGDNFGFIYHLWWWKKTLFDRSLNFNFSLLQEAPFGKIIYPDSGAFVFYTLAKFFTLLTNEVIGYNLFLLISFPLAGFFTYLLVKEILSGLVSSASDNHFVSWAAFWAGLVFTFCPYHLWKSYNHLDLAQIQWFPLLFYFLVRLFKTPNLKNSLFSAFSFALITLTNFYYGFFAILACLCFIPGTWLVNFCHGFLKKKSLIRLLQLPIIGYLLLFVFFSSLVVLPFLKTEILTAAGKSPLPSGLSGEVYSRPMDTLLLLSARPWSYVLPSIDHPFLGDWSRTIYQKISSLGSDFKYQSPFTHEGTIFVGWLTLLFSIIGVAIWIADTVFGKKPVTSYQPPETSNRWVFPFLITAIWLFLVSMPPFVYIAGKNILLPTYFLHRYFPMFRAYSRLGIVVLLCLLVPASYGLHRLLLSLADILKPFPKYFRNIPKIGYYLVLFFSLFEFTNFPPPKLVDLSVPPVYCWLASQTGDFNIVEYPKEFNVAEALLFQRIHGKGIFNPHTGSPYQEYWQKIGNIQDPNTPKFLQQLEVKYVLLHKDCLFTQPNPVDDLWYTRCYGDKMPDLRALPEGLSLVGEWGGVAVLEVKGI